MLVILNIKQMYHFTIEDMSLVAKFTGKESTVEVNRGWLRQSEGNREVFFSGSQFLLKIGNVLFTITGVRCTAMQVC